MSDKITIDGSHGEGGGQVLRTSLALSALLQKDVKIGRIREGRKRPGLAQQHLTGLNALKELTDAEVSGASIGSKEVEFSPKAAGSGVHVIDVGTAGSISLVLQTLMLPSTFSKGAVSFKIKGGTDVRWSPPVDYLKNVLLPLLRKMGCEAKLEVERRGYYPRGGGLVSAEFSPMEGLKSIEILERGEIRRICGVAHSSNLPGHIVEREARAAKKVLSDYPVQTTFEARRGFSTGTGIIQWANCDNSIIGGSALGERGVPAEKVGESAANSLLKELDSQAGVDIYAGDQLLPYMALAKGCSKIVVRELTGHIKTNIYVIEQFLGKRFEVRKEKGVQIIEAEGLGFENPFI